jgi:RimJ/RimL family protein N-acetyltransferase
MSMAASLPHVPSIFETERLVIRPWSRDESDRHFDIYSRWEVARWLGSTPRPVETLDQSVQVIDRWNGRATPDGRFGIWAAEVRDTGRVAGTVLLVPMALSGEETARPPEEGGDVEVGWHFHPDSWGNGYATEAARGAVAKGFAEGLEEVLAVVRPGNGPSTAVCRRLGMEPAGVTDKWYGVELEAFRSRRPA